MLLPKTDKTVLSAAVLAEINEVSKTDLTDADLKAYNLFCFSDAGLSVHVCNPLAPMPDGSAPSVDEESYCSLHHICAIHLGARYGLGLAEDEPYDFEKSKAYCKSIGSYEELVKAIRLKQMSDESNDVSVAEVAAAGAGPTLAADYSQIELRVVEELATEPAKVEQSAKTIAIGHAAAVVEPAKKTAKPAKVKSTKTAKPAKKSVKKTAKPAKVKSTKKPAKLAKVKPAKKTAKPAKKSVKKTVKLAKKTAKVKSTKKPAKPAKVKSVKSVKKPAKKIEKVKPVKKTAKSAARLQPTVKKATPVGGVQRRGRPRTREYDPSVHCPSQRPSYWRSVGAVKPWAPDHKLTVQEVRDRLLSAGFRAKEGSRMGVMLDAVKANGGATLEALQKTWEKYDYSLQPLTHILKIAVKVGAFSKKGEKYVLGGHA